MLLSKNYKAIYWFSFALIPATVPFLVYIKSWPALIFIATWIYGAVTGKFSIDKNWKLLWLASIPIILLMVGAFVSLTQGDTLTIKDVEKNVVLLVPVLVVLGAPRNAFDEKQIFKVYTYGLLLAVSICLGYGFYRVILNRSFYETFSIYQYKNWFLLHTGLSDILSFHPGFFAFANFFVLFYIITKKDRLTKGQIFQFIVLFVFNILLLSRLVLVIGASLILIFFLINILWRKKVYVQFAVLTMIFLGIYMVSRIEGISKRFREVNSYEYNLSNRHHLQWNTLTTRLAIWECSIDLIPARPWLGYGLTYRNYLEAKFQEKDFLYAYDSRYNTHSQYLNFVLKYGFIGALLFLVFLFFPVTRLHTNAISSGFVLLATIFIVTVFSFEDYFERVAGLTTLSAVYTLLFFPFTKKSRANDEA